METPARQRWLPWLWLPMLAGGLLVTWLLALAADRHGTRVMGHVLSEQHRGVIALLDQRIDQLMVTGRLLARPAPASEQAFRVRARQLLDQVAGLAAVEYLQIASHTQRLALAQAPGNDDGWPSQFNAWPPPMQPAEPAQQYLIVRWVEGDEHLAAAPGLVADSVPHWQNPLLRTLGQGVVTATGRTNLHRNGRHSSALRLFVPGSGDALASLVISPEAWLQAVLADNHFGAVEITVHDLSQEVKTALVTLPARGETLPAQALRSEFLFGDRQWMVTSTPTRAFLQQSGADLQPPVWLAGLSLTALASAGLALLGRRLRQAWRHRELAEAQGARLQQQLDNRQVEKSILRQALINSEQRSRDLVALSGGFVCELDERQHVAYLSAQVADLLDRAPTDLADQPFQTLVAVSDRGRFEATLQAARREKTVSRIDLHLLDADDDPVPITVRVAAIIEPLSGCTGYRLTGQPRET
ncbi:MAG: CHASE domain-containing protein [Marinobacter sp.]|uniref:CHASE domain-containing protein n=1 Tax=Marinobacter sp. TaxID=50741 RepID=UPI00299F1BEB|nr:CHASE domain-containing protein [Marinobacter sp.]MDX1635491.1 CHASE domain-containing protein [Marinobacter sp.]